MNAALIFIAGANFAVAVVLFLMGQHADGMKCLTGSIGGLFAAWLLRAIDHRLQSKQGEKK